MITFSNVKEKVQDQTAGFQYGVIVFYSLFTGALTSFIERLSQAEILDGITREDRRALILWVQNDIQKKILVGVGFKVDEIDEDILESRILLSGQEMTEQ